MEKAIKLEDTIKIALAKLYVVLGIQQLKYDETLLDSPDFIKQWDNISKIKKELKHISVKRREGWVPIPILMEHFLTDEIIRFQKEHPDKEVITVTFDMLPIKKKKVIEVISNNFYLNIEKYMNEMAEYQKTEMAPSKNPEEWVEVIQSERLSKNEPRYVIIDNQTGKLIDDAHGYGYKSKEKALAGYRYFKDKQEHPADPDVIEGSIKAVKDEVLSKKEDRYVIIDIATGEILDNAGGYGYKTKESAKAGYFYRKNTNTLHVSTPKVKKNKKSKKKKTYPPTKKYKYGVGYRPYGN